MRVRISSRNAEVPESLKQYVTEEVERLTKYFDRILDADVALGHEKHRYTVDVRLHLNGRSVQAEAAGDNPKVPVDEALEKLRRQLRRHKSKQRDPRLRGEEVVLRGKAIDVTGIPPEIPELPATDEAPRRVRAARARRRRT